MSQFAFLEQQQRPAAWEASALLREESNSATKIGVAGANDSIVLVNYVSRKRTKHSIALQHWIAMTASAENSESIHASPRHSVECPAEWTHNPYLVPHDANRCAVLRLIRCVTSVSMNPFRAVSKFLTGALNPYGLF